MELAMNAIEPALATRVVADVSTPDSRSDEELAIAAQQDPTQFVALYDRYFRRVHGYVRVRVADEATAEDITSQVFLTALAKIGSFQERGSFGAWLFRLAQNAVYDFYRRRAETPLVESTLQALPDPGRSPEDYALAADDAARMHSLLQRLATDHQHLLALRYGAGLSSREIGRILGKNPVAVRVALHRILADLRRRYSDEAF